MTEAELWARGMAQASLRATDLCDCPGQVQLVARALKPVILGIDAVLYNPAEPLGAELVSQLFGSITAEILRSMKGKLHKPGASAAMEPDSPRNTNGVREHC